MILTRCSRAADDMDQPRVTLDILGEDDEAIASIRGWTEVRWSHRVDSIPSSGAFVLEPHVSSGMDDEVVSEVRRIADTVRAHPRVRLTVDGVVRSTCLVARAVAQCAKGLNPSLSIETSGVLWPALKSSIPNGFRVADRTIRSIVTELLGRWMIPVEIGADVDRVATERRERRQSVDFSRLTHEEKQEYLAANHDFALMYSDPATTRDNPALIRYWLDNPKPTVLRLAETRESRDLAPHPHEQIGAFLSRFLKGVGLVLLEGAHGQAILSTPDFEVRPDRPVLTLLSDGTGVMHEGTILHATRTTNFDCIAELTVQGARRKIGRETVRVSHETTTPVVPPRQRIYRVECDNSIRDLAEAKRRCESEYLASRMGAHTYTCRVAGYGVGDMVLRCDSVMRIVDQVNGLDRDMYCMGISLSWSEDGPECELDFVDVGMWVT